MTGKVSTQTEQAVFTGLKLMPGNIQDYWKFLTVGQGVTPKPETHPAATTHRGFPLPTWAVSMSPQQAVEGGYSPTRDIKPEGYDPRSWFQDESGKWFYVGDPSYGRGGRPTQNTVEWRVSGQGERGQISPPGGWGQSPGAITDNPFVAGYPSDTGERLTYPSPSMPPSTYSPPVNPQEFGSTFEPTSTYEGMTPTGPNEYLPSEAGANIPTYEAMTPTETGGYYPSESWNVPTNESMYPTGPEQYLPSESWNAPTNEAMMPTGPEEYRGGAEAANVPTSEWMMPTGPEEYLPSEGANIPTGEAQWPTGPEEYLQSEAGANIPTEEGMVPEWPAEYLQDEGAGVADEGVSAAPVDQTYYYPAGDGSYTQMDSSGNPVTQQPGLANIPGVTFQTPGGPSDLPNMGPLYYNPATRSWVSRAAGTVAGIPGAIGRGIRGAAGTVGNVARGIGTGIRTAIETPGYSSPEYLRSIGYQPGQGTESLWPGAPTGATEGSGGIGGAGVAGQGGSFYGGLYAPHGVGGALPGSFAGLGQGAHGNLGTWWDRYYRQLMKGGRDPMLGYGSDSAISRYARAMGGGGGGGYRGGGPAMQPYAASRGFAGDIGAPGPAAAGGQAAAAQVAQDVSRTVRGPSGRAMSPV
jgi:hypothetical protein